MARPRDEVRREQRAAHATPPAAPKQHVNGKLREIAVLGLHELGTSERQDNMIGGMLGSEQFAMIYGESGSGKSFLAFDMAMHYALAREWMGRKVKGGGVLYIAAEGKSSWANRVEAFCQTHEIDEEKRATTPFGFVLETINLGRAGNGDVAAVIAACERWGNRLDTAIDLIIVDTMARATPGSNENDAADMSAFVSNMDTIRKATHASQLIVHHSGKNAALGARGHSSLRAAVDLELEVERIEGNRLLRIRKSRDGSDDGDEQPFGLVPVEIGRDDDGEPITSCIVKPGDPDQPMPRRKAHKRERWQLALDELNNTLVNYPETSPGGRLPNINMTTLAHFRQACERASIIDGEKPNTRNQQWTRGIKRQLQDRGHLKIDGELCWRPDHE